MKKIYFIIIALCFAASASQAQTLFSKGDKVAALGVGFATYTDLGKTTIPPISLSMEYGIKDNLFDEKSSLGVGGYLAHYSSKWDWGGYGFKYSNTVIGARGAVHYKFVDKLDTYAGVMLGYNVGSAKSYGTLAGGVTASKVGGFAYSAFAGARYYFTDRIAVFAEAGYGIAAIEVGVSLKL